MLRTSLCIALIAIVGQATAAERPLFVPTDSKAKFTILEIGGNWPNKTIVTRRVGTTSGTSYSKRLYNCESYTVKYLGSGDTLEEMKRSKPDPRMAEIVPRSIADYVGQQACKK